MLSWKQLLELLLNRDGWAIRRRKLKKNIKNVTEDF